MNYTEIKYFCASNGPGVRTALYVSGCSIHCLGCFNQAAWDFDAGQPWTAEIKEQIIDSLASDYITGLSILGGEPLDEKNQEAVEDLIFSTRLRYGKKKTIWLWTGYTLDSIPRTIWLGKILSGIDVLVDGPFVLDKSKEHCKFCGSSNQRILPMR